MKKIILTNLKNSLTGRGASGRNLPLLAPVILAAAIAAALAGCEGMWGLSENISNNTTGDNGKTDIILTRLTPENEYYYKGQTDAEVLNIAVSSMLNASGPVRFDWYTTDLDTGVSTFLDSSDPVMPGTFVTLNPLEYQPILNNDNLAPQYGYFAQAVYPAAGTPVAQKVSNMAFMNLSVPGDTDGDGYPDDWETAHYLDGYNPKIANTPYGIDLSLAGATPLGVKLAARNKNGYDDDNEYIVYGVPKFGIAQYRLYTSFPGRIWVHNLTFAGDASTSGADGSRPAIATVIVSKDVQDFEVDGVNKNLFIKTEGESGGNLVIESGANLTITLGNVNLTGGAPIALQSGANLTLKLQDNSHLEAGVVKKNLTDTDSYAAAAIDVPDGATLVIEDDTDYNGTGDLTAIGGYGDSYGAAAGIGGGNGESAGDITIESGCSGTATATSDAYAIGPGSGGSPDTGSFNGEKGSESVWKNKGSSYTWGP